MNITKTMEGSRTVLALEGRLDTVTAPDLAAELNSLDPDTAELVLDLEKLEYVSSAGLRVLLQAKRFMAGRGTLAVTNVGELVREVFDVTGFSKMLGIG